MDKARDNSMKLLAPRYARIIYPLGMVAAAISGVGAIILISRGQTLWWFNLIAAVFGFCAFGWWSYLALFVPVVRFDSKRLAWRTMATRRFQEVPVRDLVGYRMQDSFELRLRLRSGEERSLHLSQIARNERPRLIVTIEEMVNKGPGAI